MAVPCLDLHQHLGQVAIRGRTTNHGNVRGALENPFAFLLRDAAQHAKDFALLLIFLVVGQAVKDLLLRLVADGAGVVEDQVRFLHGLYLAIALGNERADDFFGVMHVHLAAEGFQVELLVSTVRHR